MDRIKASEKFFDKYILDELFEAEIKCWIAGGIIRDYFAGVPLRTDCDLFFPNNHEYKMAQDFFKKNDAELIYKGEYGEKVKYKGRVFDIINKHFESPQETIDNFDFTVCQFAIDNYEAITVTSADGKDTELISKRNKLYYGENTFIDLAKRQLMFNKIPFPASNLKRMVRYIKKGYSICSEELKKLVYAISTLEIEQPEEEIIVEEVENTSGDNFFSGID